MKINKDRPCLFIRLTNYEDYSFIKEHEKVIKEKGHVWILKIGQKVNPTYLKKVIEEHGLLIMKTPAKEGHKFYACELKDIEPKNIDVYPDYYKEFLYFNGFDLDTFKEVGYWFMVEKMKHISDDIVEKFLVSSTKSNLLKVGKETRVVQMYVEPKEDVVI